MKLTRISISLLVTVALIYVLNRGWNFGSPIPPLGKFLDPFGGFWQNAETKTRPDELLNLEGLHEEVIIHYDSLLIPHVFAKNDDDLHLAQGYVTAANRLWQMEFQTHAAAGRISELIGDAALDFDRRQRRLGMVYAAENAVKAMEANPIAANMVNSYTQGINQYIQSLTYKDLPLEYKLLDYWPENWSPLKCGLLLKNMALTLNSGDKDLEMTNALKLFGKPILDLVWPDNENVGDPIVDNAGNWNFKPITLDSLPLALPDELVTVKPLEKSPPDVGSNNWAVSGTKTQTGSPILCNDPHLSLSLPSIWYVIHLQAPGVNVMGASLPGAPTVISGFNDSIAWGVTNAQRDLVDWYKIEFKDKSKREYKSDDTWKPARQVVEKFTIKGGNDFYDTITFTHHGPVLFDEAYHGDSEMKYFSMRWIAHDPSEEIITFYKLNRAKNHDQYMDALNHYTSPAQNFAFASVRGDIAMRIQGRYPVRRKEEGKYILDGTLTRTEWQAFIPNEQNAMYKNPARGFVSSANQYPVDSTYPYYINATNYEAYRNRRINKLLNEMTEITPRDMMELQFDNYNLKAEESLPVFMRYLDTTAFTPTQANAYKILSSWDYENTADSQGASYYEAWWDALFPLIWDEIKNSKVELDNPTTYTTIRLIKEKPDLLFFDRMDTPEKETAREVIQQAFAMGVDTIEKWKTEKKKDPRWADYKDTFIGHLLRGLPAFSYHVQHGGNHDIVNASSRTHGPSWRMVVSLEKTGVRAWGVYPGGQSGNPGSPFYNNMLLTWANGNHYSFQFNANPNQYKSGIATLTLKPKTP
ncbi:MAG: penicillin acylase family protein [Bacteroidetes bacterium CHB5]|nr:penicillin acylase family protein [Bacteroidetes bacterium CHB5]